MSENHNESNVPEVTAEQGEALKLLELLSQFDLPLVRTLVKNEKLPTNHTPAGVVACTVSAEDYDRCGGGSFPVYMLRDEHGYQEAAITFQQKPLENGVDGWTNEALMTVLIDRIAGFQSGPNPNDFNVVAIKGLQIALKAMQLRVADRKARGVAGTFEK